MQIRKKLFITLSLITTTLFTQPIYGHQALDKFFKSMGGQTNSSGASSFTDNATGYHSGGGYVMRQNNVVLQPLNVALPRLGVSCNSLDLHFGAFSHLKGQQLIQMLRKIATAVPTYAMQLGLKVLGPQLENTMSPLRKFLQDMNNLSLEECNTSLQLIGGLMPANSAASKFLCEDYKKSQGYRLGGHKKTLPNPEGNQRNHRVSKKRPQTIRASRPDVGRV